jgi:hypothetical protein
LIAARSLAIEIVKVSLFKEEVKKFVKRVETKKMEKMETLLLGGDNHHHARQKRGRGLHPTQLLEAGEAPLAQCLGC